MSALPCGPLRYLSLDNCCLDDDFEDNPAEAVVPPPAVVAHLRELTLRYPGVELDGSAVPLLRRFHALERFTLTDVCWYEVASAFLAGEGESCSTVVDLTLRVVWYPAAVGKTQLETGLQALRPASIALPRLQSLIIGLGASSSAPDEEHEWTLGAMVAALASLLSSKAWPDLRAVTIEGIGSLDGGIVADLRAECRWRGIDCA